MKKMLILSTLLLGVLYGCSPYSLINSEVYNNANLSLFNTFRIITPDDGKLPPGMQMVTYYNIAAAIREQMVERGFTEDVNSPLLINIGYTIKKEIQTEPMMPNYYPYFGPHPYPPYSPFFMYPRQYYWPEYQNAQVITDIYREGVLTMDFIDIKNKVPIYSASVATILDGDSYGNIRNLKGISEAVSTLFSKFPVAVLPQYASK